MNIMKKYLSGFTAIFFIWTISQSCAQYSVFRSSSTTEQLHILEDKTFWDTYADEVLDKKTWKCPFPDDILTKNLEKDSRFYDDDNLQLFLDRRHKVNEWKKNDSVWAEIVYQASLELAHEVQDGEYSQELRKYHLLEALKDFLYHIHYFKEIARTMGTRGEVVIVSSQAESLIHDIDKLDPAMIVAYSERFEDNVTTSLWDECVYRHTHINPHHQTHCIWQDCCQYKNATRCEAEGKMALKEMVCDKVSRRLQKSLDGKMSNDVWNVEMIYYKGLPEPWLDEAEALMDRMKNWVE